MSESTNTPSGDSKKIDLSRQNPDNGRIEICVAPIREKDPEKDISNGNPGENTIVDDSEAIVLPSDEYLKGAVTMLVGTLQTKDYNKFKTTKMEAAAKSQEKHDREEAENKDKNNDGIDDRNQ